MTTWEPVRYPVDQLVDLKHQGGRYDGIHHSVPIIKGKASASNWPSIDISLTFLNRSQKTQLKK